MTEATRFAGIRIQDHPNSGSFPRACDRISHVRCGRQRRARMRCAMRSDIPVCALYPRVRSVESTKGQVSRNLQYFSCSRGSGQKEHDPRLRLRGAQDDAVMSLEDVGCDCRSMVPLPRHSSISRCALCVRLPPTNVDCFGTVRSGCTSLWTLNPTAQTTGRSKAPSNVSTAKSRPQPCRPSPDSQFSLYWLQHARNDVVLV